MVNNKMGGSIVINTSCILKTDKLGEVGCFNSSLGYVIDSEKITIDIHGIGFRFVFQKGDIASIVAREEINKEKERLKNENR